MNLSLSLKQLLYPSWSIVAVARNLFTLIAGNMMTLLTHNRSGTDD